MDLPPSLDVLLKEQSGLARRDQLYEHGITPEALRWALGRRWRMVLPGVVATFTGRPDSNQEYIAAALWAGDEAVLSGVAAARWHNVATPPPCRPFSFLVPVYRAARATGGVRTIRTRRPDPVPGIAGR